MVPSASPAPERLAPRWRSRRGLVGPAAAIVLGAVTGVVMIRLGSVQRELKALLILAGAAALVIAALRPRVGLVFLLALMPFEFHFSGTGTNEVLIVSMAAVLVWRISARAVPAWMSFGGGALVLGSFISAIGATDQTTALWGAVRWLAAIVILFAAVSLLRERPDASRRMVDIFTGSAMIVVVFAFTQKEGINTLVGPPYFAGHPNSFFGIYTVYAGYVAMAAILATGEVLIALREHRTRRLGLYAFALVFIILGIAISTSRGGLLALGAGWLLLLLLNLRRGSVVVQAVVVFAIFAGAAYLATPRSTVLTIEQRLTVKTSANAEDRTRFALQKAGERALGQSPFGLGYENFPFYLRDHVHSVYIQKVFAHAHETPVQIGLDAGWLGLAGFLTLWGWPLGLVLTRGGGGSSTVRASAFAAALGGFMAQGLFDYLFYEIDVLIFFVALIWGAFQALSVDEGAALPAPAAS
jgi:hypothetical protein